MSSREVEKRCTTEAHAAALATMGPRDVDLRPFRTACLTLLRQLRDLHEDLENEKAEGARTALMDSLEGILEDTNCDQNMIGHF